MPVSSPPPAPSRSTPSTFSDRMDAFLAWLVTAVPEFNTLAILANGGTYNVVSGPTDTTANRILLTGYMGLGAEAPPLLADFDDITTRIGFYRFDTPTLNNTTGVTAGQMIVTRYNGAALAQFIITGSSFLVRNYASGAWGAWRKQYADRNILAAVGLSSGVPTGGIIERGSNANGEYVRFADGTQICQQSAVTFTYADADYLSFTWTYPAAFVSGSVPSRYNWLTNTPADLTGITIQQIGGMRNGSGVASAACRLYRAQGAANFAAGNQIANCGLTAIGRWA